MSETVTIYKSLAQVTRLRHPLIIPMSVYDPIQVEHQIKQNIFQLKDYSVE